MFLVAFFYYGNSFITAYKNKNNAQKEQISSVQLTFIDYAENNTWAIYM